MDSLRDSQRSECSTYFPLYQRYTYIQIYEQTDRQSNRQAEAEGEKGIEGQTLAAIRALNLLPSSPKVDVWTQMRKPSKSSWINASPTSILKNGSGWNRTWGLLADSGGQMADSAVLLRPPRHFPFLPHSLPLWLSVYFFVYLWYSLLHAWYILFHCCLWYFYALYL